jgi:hypothetical protein
MIFRSNDDAPESAETAETAGKRSGELPEAHLDLDSNRLTMYPRDWADLDDERLGGAWISADADHGVINLGDAQ